MKEEYNGGYTEVGLRRVREEPMEQVSGNGMIHGVGAESQNNFHIGEGANSSRGQGDVRSSPRSYRTPGQTSDFISMTEGMNQVSVDGRTGQLTSGTGRSEAEASPQRMEKWALENAPPPIKVRVGETSEDSAPQEPSPPPSPKRMKELARKEIVRDRSFRRIFTQDSV